MTPWDVISLFFDPVWFGEQLSEKPIAMIVLMAACGAVGFAVKDHLVTRETSELKAEIERMKNAANLREHQIDRLTSQLESAKPRAERADVLESELRTAKDRLSEKDHEIDRLTTKLVSAEKTTLEDFVAAVAKANRESFQPLTSEDIDEIIAVINEDDLATRETGAITTGSSSAITEL